MADGTTAFPLLGGFTRRAAEVVAVDETRARIDVQTFQASYAIAGRVTVAPTGEIKRAQIDDLDIDPALVIARRSCLQDLGRPVKKRHWLQVAVVTSRHDQGDCYSLLL